MGLSVSSPRKCVYSPVRTRMCKLGVLQPGWGDTEAPGPHSLVSTTCCKHLEALCLCLEKVNTRLLCDQPPPPCISLKEVHVFINEKICIWILIATLYVITKHSVQFSSVTQSCPTLCDPMNRSTPGLPVHHQLPEFTQTHVHRVSDAIQPSHPLSSPPPPAPNPSQHQSLFQWVNSSHEVAKVLEFQL